MTGPKTALVISGGGMKCAYSAGAVVALAQELRITSPDIVVASSGGAGNALYYIAGQYPEILRAWREFLPTSTFVKRLPFPSLDIDYLVDTVFGHALKLSKERVHSAGIAYSIAVTDVQSQGQRFVREGEAFDILEVARATMAMPLMYGKHIPLGDHAYEDGDVSTSIDDLINEAYARGARRILCISNLQKHAWMTPAVFRWRKHIRAIKKLPADATVVHVRPSASFHAGALTRNPAKIARLIQLGRDDVFANREAVRQVFTT